MTALWDPPARQAEQVDGRSVLERLRIAAGKIRCSLREGDDWATATGSGQFRFDLIADRVGVAELRRLGFEVVSEESGLRPRPGALRVFLDPVDGSDNAARGLAHWGPSLCATDDEGPLAAVVVDMAAGHEWCAFRGGGAWKNGTRLQVGGCTRLSEAMVAVSGQARRPLEWRAARSWGAAAHELCALASGGFDAFIDLDADGHAGWDYLGGLLICTEAGAVASEAHRRDMVPEPQGRRRPLVAATPELLAELQEAVKRVACEESRNPASRFDNFAARGTTPSA